eukprot:6272980-Amphidinium_carterae.1
MSLKLKSGSSWQGWNFGASKSVAGEVVFSTGCCWDNSDSSECVHAVRCSRFRMTSSPESSPFPASRNVVCRNLHGCSKQQPCFYLGIGST